MKILLDHGSAYNFGDLGMLQGVTSRLQLGLPEAGLHIVARSKMPAQAWDHMPGSPADVYHLRLALQYAPRNKRRRLLYGVERKVRSRVLGQRDAQDRMDLRLLVDGPPVTTALLALPDSVETVGEYCSAYDAVHIVGGGFLTDTFKGHIKNPLALIRAFREQGKPVVLTGQQIGPFEDGRFEAAVQAVLRECTFVGVRENGDSLSFCERAGLSEGQYAFMGDDSFGLEPASAETSGQRVRDLGLEPGQFVAVNVRVGSYASEHGRHLERVAAMMEAVADQLGMPLLVVPIAMNEADSDVASGRRLQEMARGADVRVLDGDDLTAAAVKGVLSQAYGAFGVSYHFCTYALDSGVPAVCIYAGAYYGQKADGLARVWGEDRLALGLDGLDAAAGARQLVGVWGDDGLRRELSKRASELKELWQRTFDGPVCEAHRSGRRVPGHDVPADTVMAAE